MAFLMAMALVAAQATAAEPISIPAPEAIRALHEAAGCVVREQTGEARAVLAMDFRTRAYRERLLRLARSTDRCFDGYLASSGVTFVGALAEQLLLRDRRAADPSAVASTEAPQPRSRTEAMSFCVVRRAPAESRAVLETPVTSTGEAAALDSLRPAIAACLDGAEEAQLNRPGLRSLVALALYRLSATRAD